MGCWISAQRNALGLRGAEQGVSHVARGNRDLDATLLKDRDLRGRRILGAADDRAGVAHAAAGGSGRARDEARDGLLAVRLDPARGLDLGVAADLADQDDAVRVRILVK